MKLNVIVPILAVLFVYACNSNEIETNPTEGIETPYATDKELEGLKLNNGERWIVNHETSVGMENIETMLEEFDGKDLVQLGADVKKELGTIIKNCTMKGEDHNQYHILLHAMLKECKMLKKGKSKNTKKLKRYVSVYYVYFEE